MTHKKGLSRLSVKTDHWTPRFWLGQRNAGVAGGAKPSGFDMSLIEILPTGTILWVGGLEVRTNGKIPVETADRMKEAKLFYILVNIVNLHFFQNLVHDIMLIQAHHRICSGSVTF